MVGKKGKWLLYVAGACLATSMVGATVAWTDETPLTASAAATAQDITELDMCNSAKGDVESKNAFNFENVESVIVGEHRIHNEGTGHYSFDTTTKYFDISFQMEFSDWGDDGYIAFNTAGNNQLRIYNHKIETKALVGTGYEGRHQEQAFETEITSGWHTVRMVLDAQGETSSSGHNTFTAKVVIDGVETSYDWFAEDWGGNAYYLLNKTGVAVNVLSANSPLPMDIADLAVIGSPAYDFSTVAAVANGSHNLFTSAGTWITNWYDYDVSFQMEFGDWGDDGYVALHSSDNSEVRIYNHKIETKSLVGTQYEGRHQELAFTEEITSGWHTIRMLMTDYMVGSGRGDATFTVKVIIDGVETGYSWYGNDWNSGSQSFFVNNTGAAVNVLSTNKRFVAFDVDGGDAVENVYADTGAAVSSLPTATKENCIFEGWYESDAYETKVESIASLTENTTLYAKWTEIPAEEVALNAMIDNAYMTEGASIRLSKSGNGIRFESNVLAADVAAFSAFVGEDKPYKAVEFGTMIVPVDYLTGEETIESLRLAGKVADCASTGFHEAASDETTYRFWGSLVDINGYNYARSFIGVGYVKVTDSEENVTYYYVDYDLDNARSMYSVAKVAHADTETDYDEAEKALIKAYLDAVVIIDATGAYAGGLDAAVYTPAYSVGYADGTVTITSTTKIETVLVYTDATTVVVLNSAQLTFENENKTVSFAYNA